MDGILGFIIFVIFWIGFTRVETKVARIDEAVKRLEEKIDNLTRKEKK